MQMKKGARLRDQWGDKHCSHPQLDKEYMFGASTGDYICTQCGRSFSSYAEAEQDAAKQGDVKR